jgi:hypothetical protein
MPYVRLPILETVTRQEKIETIWGGGASSDIQPHQIPFHKTGDTCGTWG